MIRLFLPVVAATLALAVPATAQQSGLREIPETDNVGYDSGFDFEAMGIIGNAYRIGKTYFEESLLGAELLDAAIDDLLDAPSAETLDAARVAWTVARTPYLRTEVFRFVLPQVAAWEGRVNAWPLDEGLIDYTAHPGDLGENPLADANLIARPTLSVDGRDLDATTLTQDTLTALSEAGSGAAAEKNVTTGYHAIEFMLWGQDLNGTDPGAGDRPWTDFAEGDACTNDNCDRRRQFLKLVSDRLIADLTDQVALWQPGGEITKSILGADPHDFISAMTGGAREFLQVELAGERMRLALTLNDPEEEHDCFSDQTHRSHFYNFEGIQAMFDGRYRPSPGLPEDVIVSHTRRLKGGANLIDLYTVKEPARTAMAGARTALDAIVASAEAGAPFDTLIAADNPEGNSLVRDAISQLLLLSFALEEMENA